MKSLDQQIAQIVESYGGVGSLSYYNRHDASRIQDGALCHLNFRDGTLIKIFPNEKWSPDVEMRLGLFGCTVIERYEGQGRFHGDFIRVEFGVNAVAFEDPAAEVVSDTGDNPAICLRATEFMGFLEVKLVQFSIPELGVADDHLDFSLLESQLLQAIRQPILLGSTLNKAGG